MERAELGAWLRLTLTPGIGNEGARKLLGAFGLPHTLWQQPTAALRQLLSAAQVDALHAALAGVSRVLIVEQSFSRQFHQYLLANYRLPPEQRMLNRAGPLPIRPAEICQIIRTWK